MVGLVRNGCVDRRRMIGLEWWTGGFPSEALKDCRALLIYVL
jgi:hypothetical protein